MEQVLPKADPVLAESATQSSQDKKGAPQDNSEEDDLDLQRFDDLIQSLNELWLKKYPNSCPYTHYDI